MRLRLGLAASACLLAGPASWASAQQPMPTPAVPGAVVAPPGGQPAAALPPEKTVSVAFKSATVAGVTSRTGSYRKIARKIARITSGSSSRNAHLPAVPATDRPDRSNVAVASGSPLGEEAGGP